MAPRATGFAKKPAATKADRAAEPAPLKAIVVAPASPVPLALAPLLAPYRKKGRLSLRVERVPQQARLSRGRNNGNGSWSLASDELDDLDYLPPDGASDMPALAIRIIGLDQDGATLAMLDLPSSGMAPVEVGETRDDGYLRGLGDELEKAKAALAAREAELAELRAKSAAPKPAVEAERAAAQSEMKTRLEAAEAAWREKTEAVLAEARADAATRGKTDSTVLAGLRQELDAAQAALAARDTALAKAEADHAVTLAKAEAGWKAGEAARLAAAEAQWREAAAKAEAQAAARGKNGEAELARLRAEIESAKAALVKAESDWKAGEAARFAAAEARWRATAAQAEAQAAALGKNGEAAAARLRAELETTKAVVAQARTDAERARRDASETLAKAEANWKAGEAARLAAAEAQGRAASAGTLAEIAARCAKAEAALADGGVRAGAPVNGAQEAELIRLRDELAGLRTALAEREASFAKAQESWKAEEAGRLAAAETRWRTQAESALALATARFETAEAALADLRAQGPASTLSNDTVYINRLREEVAGLQKVLAGREVELAQARAAIEAHSVLPHAVIERAPRRRSRPRTVEDPERVHARRSLAVDALIAMLLVGAVVLSWPFILPLLPNDWQYYIYEYTTSLQSAPAAAPAPAHVAAKLVAAAPRLAVVTHGANMREAPSAGAGVVVTLKRGQQVELGEQRGSWTAVRVDGKAGWVFTTYLKDAGR